MKRMEKIKMQIYLFLFLVTGGYCLCNLLALIEKVLIILPVPTLIIIFFFILYKAMKGI